MLDRLLVPQNGEEHARIADTVPVAKRLPVLFVARNEPMRDAVARGEGPDAQRLGVVLRPHDREAGRARVLHQVPPAGCEGADDRIGQLRHGGDDGPQLGG